MTYTLWKDQVGKGKYTLAFFWASWSEEAQAEAANVQAVYQQYAGKGLSVLGVTYNDEISDSMDAIAEWGIKFPNIVDVEDQIAEQFEFDTVPYVALLGPDGKIVAGHLEGEGILEAVKRLSL